MNGYPQARPTPVTQHPDEPWVDLLFKLIVGGVIAVLSAVLLPVVIIALIMFVTIKLLRIPWWVFFILFLAPIHRRTSEVRAPIDATNAP